MKQTTLSKVKIQKSQEVIKKQDLYSQNNKSLSFLPTFFVVFLIVSGIFLASWRLGFFKVSTSIVKQTPTTLVGQTSDTSTNLATNNNETEAVISQKYYTNQNQLKIHKNQSQECLLNYSSTAPSSFNLVAGRTEQGFWLPQTCAEKTLQIIQVIRLNDIEIKTAQSTLGVDNVQVLDSSNKTYALVYKSDKSPTIYKLITFVKGLCITVFKDKIYLDPSNVFDTKRMEDKTYYLEGNCQNGGILGCKLWRVDNFSGEVEMLKENAVLTGSGEANELKPGYVLRFAKQQDLTQGLNFILVNEKVLPILNFKLIRLDTNSIQIIETQDINLADSGYKDYYR